MQLGKGKNAGILVVFLFVFCSTSGQTGKNFKYLFRGDVKHTSFLSRGNLITIDYSLPELNIEEIASVYGSFYRLNAPGHTMTVDPGKPELPLLSRLISIPEGSTCKITLTDVKSETVNPSEKLVSGKLFPAQYGETKQDKGRQPGFVIDKKLYASHGYIKSDTVSIEPVGVMRNKRLSALVISPVRYNPSSNSLDVITSMKITVTFSKGLAEVVKPISESALFNEILGKGVLNYYPDDLIPGFSDQPVEMIILTDTSFRKFIEPLVLWKKQKGFRVHLLYAGEGLAGGDYNAIKESIAGIYSSSSQEHPPEYLLIIGDAARIPYYGSANVTDTYYGEMDGNGDYIPDMFTGRIPATDSVGVKAAVTKIIQYEKFQFADTNTFYSRGLALAGKDASYANYMNGQIKYAVTNYLTEANSINEYHFYYPEGYTKKDSVMNLIAKGLSFINYTGHGSSAGWLHIDIRSPDIPNFNNPGMYPFIISNACRTAQFNDTASFGNKIVLASGKGAIGFIGCTNDSYWDEDFTWAVGTGSPGPDPKYEETGLGAYDRLFHTHNEAASDWYVSMGQVNFAGNLAVSSSSSLRKKYYWETYAVLGDPSIIPIIGKPDKFSIILPDTLPNGMRSLSLSVDPFAYVAISHFDTLWDASYAGPSGSVILDLPGISNDSCLVVITGQDKIPVIKTIYISDVRSEYLNLSGTAVNDILGNNNGRADFGETMYLRLKISNLGLEAAENVTATISSASPWVTILRNNSNLGTLQARSEKVIDNELEISVADNIPDLGIVTVDLTLKDNSTERKFRIDITVHAPQLEIINCIIDDSGTGNNNFTADPGETFNLVFQVRNYGTSNTSGSFAVINKENELEILESDIKSGVLQFGEISNIPITVKLSETSQFGDFISLSSTLDCNPFIVNRDFSFRVGKIRESFESATFKVFPWINLSPRPWTIFQSNAHDGVLSARSGAIVHNSESDLVIRTYYPEADSLTFFYRVSSEPNYDFLLFRLNGEEILKKSGETSWEKKRVDISAGINQMEWIYKKDNSVSQGADAAWIDLIDFAGSTPVRYIQKDIEVARIVTPVQKEVYGMEPITVKVLNHGRDTVNGFYLAYSVNNKPGVRQFFKTKLIPSLDSVEVIFDKRADLDLNGIYNISVYGMDNDDDYTLNDTLSISIENTEIEESISVFPNPVRDKLYITINSKSQSRISLIIIDAAGKVVSSREELLLEGENQFTIDSRQLRTGFYILNVQGLKFTRAVKFVKSIL